MSKLKSIIRDAAAIVIIVAVTTIEVYALCQIPEVSVKESSEQDFSIVNNVHNIKRMQEIIEEDKQYGIKIEKEEEKVEEPQEPQPYYTITEEERTMVAALVKLEAGNQSWECQAAVASVIFNRWDNHYAGAKNLHDVVYQKKQFSPAWKIKRTTPSQVQYDVVDYICKNGPTLPSKVMFFHYKRYHSFGTPYYHIGTEYFSY